MSIGARRKCHSDREPLAGGGDYQDDYRRDAGGKWRPREGARVIERRQGGADNSTHAGHDAARGGGGHEDNWGVGLSDVAMRSGNLVDQTLLLCMAVNCGSLFSKFVSPVVVVPATAPMVTARGSQE